MCADAIVLPDGRILGYAEYGDPRGQPVFVFHGWLGSRLQGQRFDAAARQLGVRIVAPDRPGFGISDLQRDRTLADWPRDVTVLADRLGIERFAAFGSSGGTPYALACAYWLRDRVRVAGLAGAISPLLSRPGSFYGRRARALASVANRFPISSRVALSVTGLGFSSVPDWMLDRAARGFPECDRAVMSSARYRQLALADMRQSFASGSAGAASDLVILTGDWGFGLGDVTVPVRLWHGEMDPVVPLAAAREIARSLPNCRSTFVPDQGHYVHVACATNVLESLLET